MCPPCESGNDALIWLSLRLIRDLDGPGRGKLLPSAKCYVDFPSPERFLFGVLPHPECCPKRAIFVPEKIAEPDCAAAARGVGF